MRQSSGVLHLAPRSVRDLIYAGRLPSVRIGRVHFVRATDLEVERRRRLGLQLPPRKARRPRPHRERARGRSHTDPAVRQQRAAERAALVNQWAQRHHPAAPELPFAATVVEASTSCAICGRHIRVGRRVIHPAQDDVTLCLACGRRALLDWADHRRLEAAAARRMADDLGAPAEAIAAA